MHEKPGAEGQVRAPPAQHRDEPHRERQDHELTRRHARAIDPEHEAAMLLEPARGHGGGDRRRRGARADGGDQADGHEELPELGHAGARHGADPHQGHAAGEHPAGAPAIGQPADEGAGQPVEGDGHRHGEAQRGPGPAELGLERLDEDADGRADAAAGQEHERGGGEDDPGVVQAVHGRGLVDRARRHVHFDVLNAVRGSGRRSYARPWGPPRSLGSRRSRRASPSMLKPKTARLMAMPGKTAIHGAWSM